jgi:hypothetical protein
MVRSTLNLRSLFSLQTKFQLRVLLRGKVLFKYQSEKSKHPYGYYELTKACEYTIEERIKHKRYFTFYLKAVKKKLTLSVENETSYQNWLAAFRHVMSTSRQPKCLFREATDPKENKGDSTVSPDEITSKVITL